MAEYSAGFPHTARQGRAQDLTDHEHAFVLNIENLQTLERIFLQHRERTRLLLDLNGGGEVPNPHYGSLERFEAVYRMLGQALEVFLETYLPR
jgi:protein-tyrosine phosphatase